MKIIANGKEIDGERFNSIYIDKEADPGYAVLTIVLFGGEEIPVATYTLDEICMAWYMLKRIARSVLVFDESIDVEAVAHFYPSEEWKNSTSTTELEMKYDFLKDRGMKKLSIG